MKKSGILLLFSFVFCFSGSALAFEVEGTIFYQGPCTGVIRVAAFDGNECGDGNVVDEVQLPGPGPYTLNVPGGEYYFCTCMDIDGDGDCPDGDAAGDDFTANPFSIDSNTSGIHMTIIYDGPCYDPSPIPTMTGWGMGLFVLLMSGTALWVLRRRKSAS